MTTEGEGDNVEKTVRTTRKRTTSFHIPKSASDDENSELSEGGSSEDEWRYTSKKKSQKRLKHRPARTLKRSLAEKAKKLKSEFNETVRPPSPEVHRSVDACSDTQKPDTTTLESSKSTEEEDSKPILTFKSDVAEKIVSVVAETNEVDDSQILSPSDVHSPVDALVKCDSSIKIELTEPAEKIKRERDDADIKNTILKCVKPDTDADTVILLSDDDDDDDDDVPNDSNTVVLNCNILQTYASPILTGSESRRGSTPTSPAAPTIRVRPLEEISNPISPTFGATTSPAVSPAVSPAISYSPVAPGISDSPFTSSSGAHLPSATPPMFSTSGVMHPLARGSRGGVRGSVRGGRQNSRARPARTRASADVRYSAPRSRRPLYNYSPRSRPTTPSRLDSISLSNISPGGTVIRNGSDSITITPTKKSPDKPAQRRLFRSEVEGIITARESGYVVSLANGTHQPLSLVQVEKLREQNNGVLPTKLRIPVPSDVAASIETRILIDD